MDESALRLILQLAVLGTTGLLIAAMAMSRPCRVKGHQKKHGLLFLWCHKQSIDFATNLIRDLKSIRALWNYIFMALYVWVCVWLVLHASAICGNTVVVTTGGIVSWIFSNYVVAAYMEKKNKILPLIPADIPAIPKSKIPDGGSDEPAGD